MQQALTHHQAGKLEAAAELYRRVLKINADHAEALLFLGVIAHQSGQDEVAVKLTGRSIELDANNSVSYLNHGAVLVALGQVDRAIESYRRSIALDPGRALAYANLGNSLLKKQEYMEALSVLAKAIELAPDNHEAINSMGVALENLGRLDQSIVCYRKALSIKPDYVEALTNLGNPLQKLGLFDEAIAAYNQALSLNPRYYVAYSNLGHALLAAGRLEEAIVNGEAAVELAPNSIDSIVNLGNAYKAQGFLDKAAAWYRRALKVNPRESGALTNLGTVYMEMGAVQDARQAYEQALAFKPDFSVAYTDLLYFHASMRDISPEQERDLAAGWEKSALSDEERLAARHRAQKSSGVFTARPRQGRKLKLGIVTAELGLHAVAEFLEPFLEQLDRERFHLTLFPTVGWRGARTERMVKLADGLVGLVGVQHSAAAQRIRTEQIDVLMDTTGHTNNCHLGIFAHRAAPVQLSYIGYWSTTGLTEMDWFIANPDTPAFCEAHYTEKLWRLPRFGSCYHGETSIPESTWEPGETIWLGSFNRYIKIREETLALWARVLKALPEARLLLEDRAVNDSGTHERILSTLAGFGVEGGRVEFEPAVPGHLRHMLLYNRLDIALDTIPFNSGTTAFDALWMGVPLVALEGNWAGGQIASSALRALGREEWVAHSDEEYVSIVCSLAGDVERRKQLRKGQRAQMVASPLCDAPGLTRALEEAFEGMYDHWLAQD